MYQFVLNEVFNYTKTSGAYPTFRDLRGKTRMRSGELLYYLRELVHTDRVQINKTLNVRRYVPVIEREE